MDTSGGGLNLGQMLEVINEPYKLSYCRACGKKRRVAKESHLCLSCAATAMAVACGLVPGGNATKIETDPQLPEKGSPRIAQEALELTPEGFYSPEAPKPVSADPVGSGGNAALSGSTGGQPTANSAETSSKLTLP